MKAVPRSRLLVFAAIALVGCAADVATKDYMFAWLGPPGRVPPCWIWQDVVGFQTSLNEGALFGMGQGGWRIFAGLSAAAAMAILYYLFWAGGARDLLLTIALACVMAGIGGNLYDRLGLPGLRWTDTTALHQEGQPVHAVRDWMLVMIGRFPWPNFNVADSLLVCGAGMLLLHAYRHGRHEDKPDSGA